MSGGAANFGGTTYQQKVAAYVAVHALGRSRLSWFGSEDDTPNSISAETGGPGDDIAVVPLANPSKVFEIQAKRGLTAGAELQDAVLRIFSKARTAAVPLRVVLAVDTTASGTLRHDVAADLDRLRAGRRDGLKEATVALLALAPDAEFLLPRIHIVCVDVDLPASAHTKEAVGKLESSLEDRTRATEAWDLLVHDAGLMCANRSARTRTDLVNVLASPKIALKPLAAEEYRRLEFCRDLLGRWHLNAALDQLASLDSSLSADARADAKLAHELLRLRAMCALLKEDYPAATEFAMRALEIDPQGLDALRTAGFIELKKGDLVRAAEFADKAVDVGRFESKAWVLKVQVDAAAGRQLVEPPHAVAQSSSYRATLAQVAQNAQDWARVLHLTEGLLREAERDPDALLLRAEAVLAKMTGADEESLAEVERLCAEVLQTLRNETDPRFDPRIRRALSVRAASKSARGDAVGAAQDVAQARDVVGDHPDVLRHAAVLRIKAGDPHGAVAALQALAVDDNCGLLALRASLKTQIGEIESARRDALSALGKLPPRTIVETSLEVAEALLDVGELALCRRVLVDPAVKSAKQFRSFLLQGRIAFQDARPDEGEQSFLEAADVEPRARRGVLFELASLLRKGGLPKRASDTIAPYLAEPLDDFEVRLATACLFDADRFAEADRVISSHYAGKALPAWALSVQIEIAQKRGDFDGVIAHLREFATREGAQLEARLQLSRLLYEANRPQEARTEALAILDEEPIEPLLRMQTALLLARLRCSQQALQAAFRSYREARQNHLMHQGLITISSIVREAPAIPEVVAADTFVRLTSGDEIAEYSVYSRGPVDPSRGELSLEDAEGLGLLDKRIGDSIVLGAGPDKKTWQVSEILSAVHHAIQDAFANYETNFPAESFLRSIPAPSGTSFDELLPLMRIVMEKNERQAEVLRIAQARRLPFGFIAGALGISLPAVMEILAGRSELLVDVPLNGIHDESARLAARASEIVVTRSALHTAATFQLLDRLAATFKILAPLTLRHLLLEELREAGEMVSRGRALLSPGGVGVVAHELPPGHPDFIVERDKRAKLVKWCEAHVHFMPRPFDWLDGDDEEQRARDAIGRDSWDALELSHRARACLYADDLGLRRMGHRGEALPSFSTISLVTGLFSRSRLSSEERLQLLRELILAGYEFGPIDQAFLGACATEAGTLGQPRLARLFGCLGAMSSLGEAATHAARTIKTAATATVQTAPLSVIVAATLDAMSRAWQAGLCVQQLRAASREEFVLLPTYLKEIDRACEAFLRSQKSSQP